MSNHKKMVIEIIRKNLKLKRITDLNLKVGSIPIWDSMMQVKIFFELKTKFNKINIKNAANVRSIKDWVELVDRIY
ncbi:MAG: hypothetical protein CBD25_001145 [Candidatus Pelagibacter sp. TMED165]|nr:MAG: hypothetical protein CBD25_001145 [Candidatus Pelagibacter sp. TMED165]|tara:strand:+ start:1351 stop:1578 length:228 start_codon:yes stop_codon:yes gene_type:complete